MKLNFVFALFSSLTGYLLSSISFIGNAGISLFYKQYQFLKIWWKGALLVFIVWIVLYIIQLVVHKKFSKITSKITSTGFLLIAIAGVFVAYVDFRGSLSHHLLGARFHLGVYLFWLGWIAISAFVLLDKRKAFISASATQESTQEY